VGTRMLVLLAVIAAPAGSNAQLRLPPFDIRVPKPPTAVASDGTHHLIYELRITNTGRTDYALQQLAVLAGERGVELGRWSGDSLKRMAVRVADQNRDIDARVISSGRQVLVYLDVLVVSGAVPPVLEHWFYLTHPDSLSGAAGDTLTGFLVPVASNPPVLAAPLKSGPWLAANGPGNASGHRRTVVPLEGVGRISQRFATDWIKIGPDGRLWTGDSLKNENWYGYKEPLLAVGAGTVVATKDGIIENVPFNPKMAVPITLETVGGNHVIIDLGGGVYGFYAHLIPGSLRVKVGDKVRAGQVIGLLGNSGNSTAPHLHFHLGDRNSPLGTEGLPFAIDEYVKLGKVAGLGQDRWVPGGEPEATRRRELPFENQVVRFKP